MMYRFFSIKMFLPLLVLLMPSLGHACFDLTTNVKSLFLLRSVNLPDATILIFQGTGTVPVGLSCQITPVFGNGTQEIITDSGVTLDLSKTQMLVTSVNPVCQPTQTDARTLTWPGFGGSGCGVIFNVIFRLEGTSTNTDPTRTFPCSFNMRVKNLTTNITSFIALFTTANCPKVPVTPTPTCSTTISPSNLTLDTISLSDIPGTAGSFTTKGQKSFQLSLTCPAGSYFSTGLGGSRINLFPTFTFGKKVSDNNFDIAISNTGTDLGFGFRLLSLSSGAFIKSGTSLNTDPYAFTDPLVTQTVSKTYRVQYVRTSSTITPGSISATVVVSFNMN